MSACKVASRRDGDSVVVLGVSKSPATGNHFKCHHFEKALIAQHYGTAVLPTKPRTPRHKGKIERGVDYA